MLNHAIELTLEACFRAAASSAGGPSPRVVEVAAMFGLGVDQDQAVEVLRPTRVTLRPGQVVFVTGASGSGKSTLLRLIAEALAQRGPDQVRVIDFARLPDPPETAVVDAVDDGRLPLDRVLRVLSLAGLNDAFVMLRRPAELSDGQRYRFQLARTMARVEAAPERPEASEAWGRAARTPRLEELSNELPGAGMTVVLADEFGATLDRTTAAAVARNVRRWVSQTRPPACGGSSAGKPGGHCGGVSGGGGVCFVAATTHDDLLEPLAPDVLIEKHLGGGVEVVEADDDR